MGLPRISTGSPRKRPVDRASRGSRITALALAAVGILLCGVAAAETKLLDPERAFAFSVQALDEKTVEARFVIAKGYYLYRNKLRLKLEPGTSAPVTLPPGEIHEDDFFGKVETYRGRVAVELVLDQPAPRTSVTVTAESQGCADAGVCYLPQVQKLTVALPARGAPPGPAVNATPPKKTWLD
jgi:thioredoxin:protein disulfide reductase